MSFQQLIIDMGASATDGLKQSMETSSSLSYIRQLSLDSVYAENLSDPDIRVRIRGQGVAPANTAVLTRRGATSAQQIGGTEIYEMLPFANPGKGRQIFSCPYPVLESKVNHKVSALEVEVSGWDGRAVTWDRLCLFFRVQGYQPHEDSTGFHRIIRDPLVSQGLNEF